MRSACLRATGSEVDVAAGEREAVGLPARSGQPTISMPKPRSLGHASDHGELLEVLLARTRPTCGRAARKSFVTTVVTPRKCPGRF